MLCPVLRPEHPPVVCHPSDRAPFPPRPPPPLLAGLFGRFIGTTRLVRPLACSTAASAPHLPAAARDRCARLRARRGLPGSDAFLSCVMGSLTTAERQPLAYRDRTCCLRRFLPARPLRFFWLSRLNNPPHTIAVYASRPPSPTTTQHSLPGARYGLPAPVFHRQDRASLPGAQEIQINPTVPEAEFAEPRGKAAEG